MRRIFFCVFILLIVLSVVATAQTTRYTFVKNFPSDVFRTRGGNGCAGVAVDPEGKIWFIPYDVADSILNGATGKMSLCRVVYCFNRDGTQASFSPIKTVTVAGKTDTLWNSQTGMRADANGNIVFAAYDVYYRLNYKTGAGMNKIQFVPTKSEVQPAFDDANEMFIGGVIPPLPIKIYDNSWTFLGNVVDSSSGFARSMEVSADGNDVFWAGYTNNAVYKYHSDFGTLGNYSKVDTVMKGLSVESITRNRKTGVYWASGGSLGATVNDYHMYKWYAFAPTNLNKAIDSIVWNGPTIADPRPRGLAFSPSGDTAYVAGYNTNTIAPIQMFVKKVATTVTFWANTSTVPDTLKSNSFIQIRGSDPLMGPWGSGSSMIMANVSGDYWKYTAYLHPGDTIQYKFFTNANKSLTTAIQDQGWENNSTDPSGNRILIVKSDTVLPIQFVNGTPTNQAQFFTPYVNQKDSVEIYFRINMQGNESFNKATQYLGVRGAFAPPYDGWGKSIVLKQEGQHGNGGSQQYDGTNFWSGYTRVPKSLMASAIEYKFVIMDAPSPTANVLTWEDGIKAATDVTGGGNRQILANPSPSDTTLYWKWWVNNPYAGFKGSDTVIVTYRANLANAIASRGFSFTDTLQVRSGFGATAKAVTIKPMTRSGLTGTIFTATDTIISKVGAQVNYQYYLVKSGNDVREVFYDYDFSGTDVSQAERRKVTVVKGMTVYDTASTNTDMRRMPRFRNLTHLSKTVTVLFTLDLRPAYYQVARGDTLTDIQGTQSVTKSSNIKTMGVAVNGPAVGGWGSWGPLLVATTDTVHKMYDDATHGDVVANDTIYSVRRVMTVADYIGNEFKFGIGGGDNEGGRGGFGNNHIENIDDSQTTYVLASDFGSINPKFYNTWDFNLHKGKTPTAVGDYTSGVPTVYKLEQNYPNPFNPSTTIRFNLPTSEIVTLKIFNMLGQEVMVLLHDKMPAGSNTVRFDASRLTSGVYFYQINAGKFVETKKMMLLK